MTNQHTSQRVTGGAGVTLHVEETGNPAGPAVLFLHGVSQCRLAWDAQMRSDLGRDLRLVTMDLRGHGQSDKPREGYDDPQLWADDVQAVIASLRLERPVLCGWSYGGVVIADYLRAYGEGSIGGISLVGAVSRLGESVIPFLGKGFLELLPGAFSTDVESSSAALQAFLRITTRSEPTPEQLFLALGYNTAVPPYVREAMMSRAVNHDDTLEQLSAPVLITHGLEDQVVLPTMSEHHASLVAQAKTSWYRGVGHSPFTENPDRFNTELREFALSCDLASAGAVR